MHKTVAKCQLPWKNNACTNFCYLYSFTYLTYSYCSALKLDFVSQIVQGQIQDFLKEGEDILFYMIIKYNHMKESATLGKIAIITVPIALGFTLCDFPVAVQFFPKWHSSPFQLSIQILYTI